MLADNFTLDLASLIALVLSVLTGGPLSVKLLANLWWAYRKICGITSMEEGLGLQQTFDSNGKPIAAKLARIDRLEAELAKTVARVEALEKK